MSSIIASSGVNSSSIPLPYGYQIDLDFIRYCENLTNYDATDGQAQRRQKRRQRQSMEVMLGIQKEMQRQLEMEMFDEKMPPEPPPRSHHHVIESPIVPRYSSHAQQQWDVSLKDVVHDFERTLERSKKKSNERDQGFINEKPKGDCIPSPAHKVVHRSTKVHHTPIESFDGSFPVVESLPNENELQKRINDLEEQSKLIPLLQLQIQALRDERQNLQQQLREIDFSKSSSSSSSSPPHPQQPQMFQAHRVSPINLAPIKSSLKSTLKAAGTNTNLVLHRDVGTSPLSDAAKVHNRSVSTDFILPHDSPDGGRLYTERDLKKAIEMAHARIRKATITVGTQMEAIIQRSISVGSMQVSQRECATETEEILTKHVACETNEPHLMMTLTPVKAIDILPSIPVPVTAVGQTISLKDITATQPIKTTRSTSSQTQPAPIMIQQSVQNVPKCETRATQSTFTNASVLSKATDTQNLTRSIHKMSMTDIVQHRDQISHTLDLIRVHAIGTNTPSPIEPMMRSTASNTNTVHVKSVAIQGEIDLHATSKIPRPSPGNVRKFTRQDTFTVQKSPEPEEIQECPAEKLLRLTMTQTHQSLSPMMPQSPDDEIPSSLTHPHPEPTAEETMGEDITEVPSKMVQSPSVEYLDDDDEDFDDDDDDKFNDGELLPPAAMRPPPTSISTIRLCQQDRVKIRPTKEMIAALKVLNDNLQQSPQPSEAQIKTAKEIASTEWFRISSVDTADPNNVEDYLDFFEEQSWELLTFMVNLTDKNGNTAMHYSVSHGNFDIVSLLLDSKVSNINQTNNAGYTCVMLVSLAKLRIPEHRTVVQRLFKLSDVNIRATKNSQTALMLAVSHGNLDMVQMLVEAGADINIQDDDGSTALMCAAEHGHIDIVKYLLAQPDCDSTKQDVDSSTALKISLEAGFHDIGCLLYAHEHLLRNKSSGLKRASSMKSSTSSLMM